jgi:hypothetical protein
MTWRTDEAMQGTFFARYCALRLVMRSGILNNAPRRPLNRARPNDRVLVGAALSVLALRGCSDALQLFSPFANRAALRGNAVISSAVGCRPFSAARRGSFCASRPGPLVKLVEPVTSR